MTFWKTWETWEKMVFILACSMVIARSTHYTQFKTPPTNHHGTTQVGVIIAGGFVAWLNRRKVKLYNQAFADEAERVQTIVSPEGTRISDVPFGARALENGVKVDGIYTPGRYISRQGSLRQYAAGASVLGVPTPLTPTVTHASHYEHQSTFSPHKG